MRRLRLAHFLYLKFLTYVKDYGIIILLHKLNIQSAESIIFAFFCMI